MLPPITFPILPKGIRKIGVCVKKITSEKLFPKFFPSLLKARFFQQPL
jgi:hypothetical protein